MKKVLAILALSISVAVSLAEPSSSPVALKKAAEWAVIQSNIELLRALLQAGVQIDEPVDDNDDEWTMLHLAALHNKPRVVQFLLDNGAPLDIRCKGWDRPIDMAFDNGCTNVCLLLVKPEPDQNERMIGDFPEAVIEEVLRPEYSKEPTFVSLNNTNAPAALVDWLGQYWTDVRPTSQTELTEFKDGKYGHIQDKETKEAGRLYDIMIKKTTDGYDWAIRSYHGPLAAWGQSGKLIRRYGYWLRTVIESWES